MPATVSDLEVARYFRESYFCWAVGQLDPAVEQELDELSLSGWENWKEVMEREFGYTAAEIQNRHAHLCATLGLSPDEALDALLRSESV